MLVSKRHKVAFVHIPKCGGSTIRHQFSNISDTGTDFSDFTEHPVLGRVHLAHLPLRALKEHYPDTFESLKNYRSFALSRNVFDRFESAVAQHLLRYKKKRINNSTHNEVLKVSREIIENIRENDSLVSAQYCHFIRQSDFIFFEGERIISDVYPLSQIDKLANSLSAATGVTISTDLHSNQTLSFNIKGSELFLRNMSGIARRLLPIKVYSQIKKNSKGMLTRKGSMHAGFAQSDTEISDFIRTYYAEDFKLFASVSKISVSQK